jgi:hypothetical protein
MVGYSNNRFQGKLRKVAESGYSLCELDPGDNAFAEAGEFKAFYRNDYPLTLFTAGEALPFFQLYKYRAGFSLDIFLVIPADTYLVFLKITGSRPCILLQVYGIEIETADRALRVFSVRTAYLP